MIGSPALLPLHSPLQCICAQSYVRSGRLSSFCLAPRAATPARLGHSPRLGHAARSVSLLSARQTDRRGPRLSILSGADAQSRAITDERMEGKDNLSTRTTIGDRAVAVGASGRDLGSGRVPVVRACAAAMVAQRSSPSRVLIAPTAAVCTHAQVDLATAASHSPPFPSPLLSPPPPPLPPPWHSHSGRLWAAPSCCCCPSRDWCSAERLHRTERTESHGQTTGNRSPPQTGRPSDGLRAGCSTPPSLTASMPASFILLSTVSSGWSGSALDVDFEESSTVSVRAAMTV